MILIPWLAGAQKAYIYGGVDGNILRGGLNVNLHGMLKVENIIIGPSIRLYTMGKQDQAPLFGGRIGYECGKLFSITPLAGYYFGYHGPEMSDKLFYNGPEWEYGMRFKWSLRTFDAAGLYMDVSRIKRLKASFNNHSWTSVTFGMTIFEPNNRQQQN
jgi:hypothetical protein